MILAVLVQAILTALCLVGIIVLVYRGPRIIFAIRQERMLVNMLCDIPAETDEDDEFHDIIQFNCENDDAFLWRVHSHGKHSFDRQGT